MGRLVHAFVRWLSFTESSPSTLLEYLYFLSQKPETIGVVEMLPLTEMLP